MNWNTFIPMLTALYALYYAGLWLLERYRRPKAAEDAPTTYVVVGAEQAGTPGFFSGGGAPKEQGQ